MGGKISRTQRVNRRLNIHKDIKCYQDTLSYASSKVDYSLGENIYILPSDMNLHIKTETVGYNNKIFISDSKFNLGKNDNVNTEGAKISHKIKSHKAVTTATHKEPNDILVKKPAVTCEEEKITFNWGIYNVVHVSARKHYFSIQTTTFITVKP